MTARGDLPSADVVATVLSDDEIHRVGRLVAQLDATSCDVLLALAVGTDLDRESLATGLDLDGATLATAIADVRATGLVGADGRIVPLAARAVLQAAAPERTRALRLRLLRAHHLAGRDTTELAAVLAGGGVRDGLLSEVLTAAGDRTRSDDPAAALDHYADAVRAGADAGPLAVRRAETAVRAGRYRSALQLVDPVLQDPNGTDFAPGMEIAATAMANGGQLGRAGELYRWLEPHQIGAGRPTAVYALVATGDRALAARMTNDDGPAPTLGGAVRAQLARGLLASLDDDVNGAMAILHRTIAVAEVLDEAPMLPDTPTALTALVGIHTGDLDIAGSALRRAVDRDLNGSPVGARHRLLLAWVAMLRGQHSRARRLVEEVSAGAEAAPDQPPRDQLFIAGLRLGLARRASDAPGLVAAWNDGRDILLRHPVDLFVLLPIGEFVVAAARLQDFDRLGAHLADTWRLLDDLDQPLVWAPAMHWYAVQAAILRNRPDEVEPHAAALVEAAVRSEYAAALAAGGRAWVRVLADDIAPSRVERAARQLEAIGLGWDGSRLLGQAAARSGDRQVAAGLLQAARALQAPDEPEAEPITGRSRTALLSPRENEVVELLLQQQTYREIGQRLYISPKTVEHHVARIKQRIGATGRADLLARLRAHLAQPGT